MLWRETPVVDAENQLDLRLFTKQGPLCTIVCFMTSCLLASSFLFIRWCIRFEGLNPQEIKQMLLCGQNGSQVGGFVKRNIRLHEFLALFHGWDVDADAVIFQSGTGF